MKSIIKIAAVAAVLVCLFLAASCADKSDESSDNVFYVNYKNVKIEMGAEADAIISSLGEAQNVKEIGDCGGLGAQVKYSYPSLEIYVLASKTDGNIIDQISFRNDVVTTPEGVYIGMSIDDAKTALGEPDTEKDSYISYVNGKFILKISVENEKVTEINYITNTNN